MEEAGRFPRLEKLVASRGQARQKRSWRTKDSVWTSGHVGLGVHFPTPRVLVVMTTGLDIPISGVLAEGKLFAYIRQRCPQEAQAQDRAWIVGITPCVCKAFFFFPSPHRPSLSNFSGRNRN